MYFVLSILAGVQWRGTHAAGGGRTLLQHCGGVFTTMFGDGEGGGGGESCMNSQQVGRIIKNSHIRFSKTDP